MLSEQQLLTSQGCLALMFVSSYFFCPFIFFCNTILTLIQFRICEAAEETLFNAAEICYKSSFAETILKDVVSFMLLFHKIVFQVNKLLTEHESD